MNITIFIGCDFTKDGPFRTLRETVESFSQDDSKVYPIVSNSDNATLIEAFGITHPDIDNKKLLTRTLGIRIKAMIRNCDFHIFDVSDYKKYGFCAFRSPRKSYCLNVINELGIATAFATDDNPMDGRLFYRKGLEPTKDISNLQGELPLASGPYKNFEHLKRQLTMNLLPLVDQKRRGNVP